MARSKTAGREIAMKPALLVVDVQNCFMAPGGSFDKMQFDINEYQTIVKPLQKALQHAHRISLPIFFSKAIREQSGIDNLDRVHRILPATRRERINRMPLCVRGTWDADIIDAAKLDAKNVYILEKRRDSAFWGTELEVWLKALGIDTLIFAGVDTSICVESTLRDAFNIGYDVILLSDCTASRSKAFYQSTLDEVCENFGLVMSSDEFFSRLTKKGDGYEFRLPQ